MLFELLISLIITNTFADAPNEQIAQEEQNAIEISEGAVKGEAKAQAEDALTEQDEEPLKLAKKPKKIDELSLGIQLNSKGAVAIDATTGEILFAHNPHDVISVASLTKLVMGLTLVEQGVSWDEEVVMQEEDERVGGRFRVYKGEKLKMEELLHIVLIASDNNSAVAMVRAMGLKENEFVQKMNELVYLYGQTSMTFTDSTGLDMNNMSSALDIARIARIALRHDILHSALSQAAYRFKPQNGAVWRTIYNTNTILGKSFGDFEIKGGKTGTLNGLYNLLITAEDKEGNTIIVAVLGAGSNDMRYQEASAVVAWVFEKYTWNLESEIPNTKFLIHNL